MLPSQGNPLPPPAMLSSASTHNSNLLSLATNRLPSLVLLVVSANLPYITQFCDEEVTRSNFEISLCPHFHKSFLCFLQVRGPAMPQTLSENLQGLPLPFAPGGKLFAYSTEKELFSKPLFCTPSQRSPAFWPLPDCWCQCSAMVQLSADSPFSLFPSPSVR